MGVRFIKKRTKTKRGIYVKKKRVINNSLFLLSSLLQQKGVHNVHGNPNRAVNLLFPTANNGYGGECKIRTCGFVKGSDALAVRWF